MPLAGRVAWRYGQPVAVPESLKGRGNCTLARLFPSPQKLARARFNDIGLTRGRADTIRRLARVVVNGDLDFDTSQDPADFRERLMSISGIGDWTAQYVAMRALKNPDAFPASDLGLLKAMGAKLSGARSLRQRAESWRPWRAYAALLLWGSLPGSGG